jgi:hypothetical protein
METAPPELIAINHDDYHAEHVGRTRDGRQFFLTTPFEPALGEESGGEYVALFVFDDGGNLIEAKIDDSGHGRPSTRRNAGASTKVVFPSWATSCSIGSK